MPPCGRTLVLGAGKAAAAMAQAVESGWPLQAPLSGLVVTRYGHIPPCPTGLSRRIAVVEAGHPVPDAAGVAAATRMFLLTKGLTPDDLVLFLVSGGGSALMTLPAPGVSLTDKQRTTQALLDSGATIAEINCVRKHLSSLKGGHLAQACAPARLVTLAISDVPGDDPSIIASGPTMADSGTCLDALLILKRYSIDIPAELEDLLGSGALETPKPGDPAFDRVTFHLVSTPQQCLQAAADAARSTGLQAYVLGDAIEGEARDVAREHAALARSVACQGQPFSKPCVLLSGGETTVTLSCATSGVGRGRGGRNGEFCLALAQELAGQPGVYALAADTDGLDGVEKNAGAWVHPETIDLARAAGMDVGASLHRHDAYGFFERLGDLFVTGPTFTNVNDFRVVMVL